MIGDLLVIRKFDGCCIAIQPVEVRHGDSGGDKSRVKYTIFAGTGYVDILSNNGVVVNMPDCVE